MGVLDWALDRSIFYSFDRSGYRRHCRRFDAADLHRSMRGKTCLVTGANSGLGLAVARGLAAREATVHMLCRDRGRGAAAARSVSKETGNAEVHLELVDLSSLGSVSALARHLDAARVDVLVHNAGLLPLERTVTTEGLELTVATHVVGPFLLTELLRSRLRGARVVVVTSGGMYTKRLDVDEMLSSDGPYDGVAAYAMTKRAQVVLTELLAEKLADAGTTVNAMHPGWAATKGVERSLPTFFRLLRGRLRSPEEGADTALWLAVAERVAGETGKLWFDRQSVPTHLAPWTREDAEQRRRLFELCEEASRPFLS